MIAIVGDRLEAHGNACVRRQNMCRLAVAATVGLVVSVVFADDPIRFVGTYDNWGKSPSTAISDPTMWSGGGPIDSEHDYLITSNKFCGFGGNGTFGGRSIILGESPSSAIAGYLDGSASASTPWTYNFTKVVMNRGGICSQSTGGILTIGGEIVVNGPEKTKAVYIRSLGGNNSQMIFSGPISGAGHLRVYKQSQGNDQLTVRFTGNMSGFTGTMHIGENETNDSYFKSRFYRTRVLIGDTEMGCSVIVRPCGSIGPCGTGSPYYGCFSVPNVTFMDGSAVSVAADASTNGTVRVTGSISLPESGKVCVDVRGLPGTNTSVRRIPVLRVPAGSGISTNSFRLFAQENTGTPEQSTVGKLAACSLEVADEGSREVLYLVMGKYTYLKTSDASGKSSWTPQYASHWNGMEDGTPLDPDTVYVSYNRQVVTPNLSGTTTFGGKRLVISGSGTFVFDGLTWYTVPDLVLANDGFVKMRNNNSSKLMGLLTVFDPNGKGTGGRIYVAGNRTGTIESTLRGDGVLQLMAGKNQSPNKDNGNGAFVLTGTNTAFAGRIVVSNDENDPATNTTFRISDARAIGGPRSAFAYNALAFSHWSRLRADATLAIVEPTRGVYFVGGNYVSVTGATHTLTLATQTTLAGTLVKEGPGTLALGGVLKFTSSQSATPLAGTNVLQVSAGRIRPASKGGADGLAISFAAGTGLKFAPISETDADVARYGLYDMKWATPFDLTGTDGKLDVALELPDDAGEIPAAFSFGVCTVPTAAASALDGNVVLPMVRGYRESVTATPNGDGSTTFTAKYVRRGLAIVIE